MHIEPQHYSGEIPIGSDIIHVSGGDAERDFEDDHLAPPKPLCRPFTRLIHFNPENLSEIKAYLPIKTFKLRKPFEQLLVIEIIF